MPTSLPFPQPAAIQPLAHFASHTLAVASPLRPGKKLPPPEKTSPPSCSARPARITNARAIPPRKPKTNARSSKTSARTTKTNIRSSRTNARKSKTSARNAETNIRKPKTNIRLPESNVRLGESNVQPPDSRPSVHFQDGCVAVLRRRGSAPALVQTKIVDSTQRSSFTPAKVQPKSEPKADQIDSMFQPQYQHRLTLVNVHEYPRSIA